MPGHRQELLALQAQTKALLAGLAGLHDGLGLPEEPPEGAEDGPPGVVQS